MIDSVFSVLLFALSLCADSFAVSLCSSVTLKRLTFGSVARVALVFAAVQAALFLLGYLFGHLFVGLVQKIAGIIGFVLLVYVGGSMTISGLRGESEVEDLGSWKHILIGGLATSLDALAVGVSLRLASQVWSTTAAQAAAIFIFTALASIIGVAGGKKIGERAGRWARIIGGLVLIAIGTGLFF